MKPEQPSFYFQDWKKTARQDWHRLLVLLEDGDPEGASFFLQQTLEKFLKAYLLQNGWKLKKIHALQVLLNEALPYNDALKDFLLVCERVSAFYLADRYPTLGTSQLDAEDIQEELSDAREFIEALFPGETLE